jgi:hypothetical protein
MAACSHSSSQEQEADGEATSCYRAGDPAVRVSAPLLRLRWLLCSTNVSATMVVTPPPVVGAEAMLVTASALLNNPPGPNASLNATEQWRTDVDQLIIIAINMSSHRRQLVHHSGGAPAPSHA